jgi:hypothetical protein
LKGQCNVIAMKDYPTKLRLSIAISLLKSANAFPAENHHTITISGQRGRKQASPAQRYNQLIYGSLRKLITLLVLRHYGGIHDFDRLCPPTIFPCRWSALSQIKADAFSRVQWWTLSAPCTHHMARRMCCTATVRSRSKLKVPHHEL